MPIVLTETELTSGKGHRQCLPASSNSLELAFLIPSALEIYCLSPVPLHVFTSAPFPSQISKLMEQLKIRRLMPMPHGTPGCGQAPLPTTYHRR